MGIAVRVAVDPEPVELGIAKDINNNSKIPSTAINRCLGLGYLGSKVATNQDISASMSALISVPI